MGTDPELHVGAADAPGGDASSGAYLHSLENFSSRLLFFSNSSVRHLHANREANRTPAAKFGRSRSLRGAKVKTHPEVLESDGRGLLDLLLSAYRGWGAEIPAGQTGCAQNRHVLFNYLNYSAIRMFCSIRTFCNISPFPDLLNLILIPFSPVFSSMVLL